MGNLILFVRCNLLLIWPSEMYRVHCGSEHVEKSHNNRVASLYGFDVVWLSVYFAYTYTRAREYTHIHKQTEGVNQMQQQTWSWTFQIAISRLLEKKPFYIKTESTSLQKIWKLKFYLVKWRLRERESDRFIRTLTIMAFGIWSTLF